MFHITLLIYHLFNKVGLWEILEVWVLLMFEIGQCMWLLEIICSLAETYYFSIWSEKTEDE